MARLPMISGDEFVRALRKAGYIWDHTEGSHMILLHSLTVLVFTNPAFILYSCFKKEQISFVSGTTGNS